MVRRSCAITETGTSLSGYWVGTSYYQNTYDFKTDEVEDTKESLDNLIAQLEQAEEEECESCKI